VIQTKAIKPGKFDERAIFAALEAEAEKISHEIKADFEKTVATWNNKPVFERIVSVGPSSIDVLVGTDDQIYNWVDKGTRPHVIFAGAYTGKSNKTALVFPGTFTAKSIPGVISSRAGSKGGDRVVRPYVNHPGTEARKFDETIAKKWKTRYKRRMEAALKKGATASGHAAN
jgi:hypothetical protein